MDFINGDGAADGAFTRCKMTNGSKSLGHRRGCGGEISLQTPKRLPYQRQHRRVYGLEGRVGAVSDISAFSATDSTASLKMLKSLD